MSITADIGLVVLFVLAFGNGANDVGKSIVALMTDPETATFRPILTACLGRHIQRPGQCRCHSHLGQTVLRVHASELPPDGSRVLLHTSGAGGCGGLDPARNSAKDSSLDNACNRRCDHCTGGLLARCFESTMGLSHLEDPPSPSCWSVCCIRRSLRS